MAEPPPRPPVPPADVAAADALPRAVPVKRPQRSVPLAVPSAAPVVPADAAPRPPPKIVQRPVPARPDPAHMEEVPQSVRRSSGGGGSGNRIVGERRPDETGMLPIVPLSAGSDKAAAANDPSATSFFAIPAPKTPRASAPPSGGPGAFQPPPVAPVQAYASQPAASPVRPGGVAGYGAVAGYGGAAAAANPNTPFQVAGPGPAGGSSAETRVQSQRVWVLMLVMAMLAGMAVLSVVAIVLYTNHTNDTAGTPGNAPIVPAPAPTLTCASGEILVENVCVKDFKDCGNGESVGYYDTCPTPKVVAPTLRCTAPLRAYRGKCVDPGSIPVDQPPKVEAPVAARASLTVTFTGDPLPTSATLQCGDDKLRGTVNGGRVTFADVPTSGSCTLRPSSAMTYTPAKDLHGGKNYTCSVLNYQTNCN